MADHEKNENSELLKAQAHIWNHIFNFINSMSLKCAVELGIPDIIHKHGKPITVPELSSALSIHPTKSHCLSQLMRILVHSGFFAPTKTNQNNDKEDKQECYILTNSSLLLLKDHPFSLTPFSLFHFHPIMTKPWEFLSNWFVNDDPTAFGTAHGMPFWDYVVHDPHFGSLFNEGMSSDARLIASVLINQGKEVFHGLNSVVDVGGGTGSVAKAIAEAFPNVECTVLDLPHVVAGVLNTTPNLKYVSGDMFESIPAADAVLLKWVFHDWEDKECVKILKQCKKAIEERKGGKVIIIEMVMMENEKGDYNNELFLDMLMMMVCASKERNENEWAKLFSDAGFSGYKIIPILGLRSIIEVYP